MSQPQNLDVRAIPPPQRHPRIFATFDNLDPDEAFILINDHYPKPLLYQFQIERAGSFDWHVLEAGPERFRVEIRRRKTSGSRTVSECLNNEHQRLDTIVSVIRNALENGDMEVAGGYLNEFTCGLARHIDIEEQLLIPVFERATGIGEGGLTGVMRRDHLAIRGFVRSITRAITSGNAGAAITFLDDLLDALEEHNRKEENILYPATDDVLGTERARNDLVNRLQAF